MTRKASRERSELYGREYVQGKVTYSYTSNRIRSDKLSSFFFPEVVTGSWQNWLGRTWLYCYSQNLGLTNKRHEVTRNESQ